MLEEEKAKGTNHLEILNNRRDEYMKAEYIHESHLAQLREEIYHMENGFKIPNSGMPEIPGSMHPMSNVYSTMALTYNGEGVFLY
jgi:hypothetical protein